MGEDHRRSFDYASRGEAARGFAQDDTSILGCDDGASTFGCDDGASTSGWVDDIFISDATRCFYSGCTKMLLFRDVTICANAPGFAAGALAVSSVAYSISRGRG